MKMGAHSRPESPSGDRSAAPDLKGASNSRASLIPLFYLECPFGQGSIGRVASDSATYDTYLTRTALTLPFYIRATDGWNCRFTYLQAMQEALLSFTISLTHSFTR